MKRKNDLKAILARCKTKKLTKMKKIMKQYKEDFIKDKEQSKMIDKENEIENEKEIIVSDGYETIEEDWKDILEKPTKFINKIPLNKEIKKKEDKQNESYLEF